MASIPPNSDPRYVASAFDLPDRPIRVSPQPGGHIHRSWVVTCADGTRYVLQSLNRKVFPDPDAVMSNVVRVTSHLSDAGEPTLAPVRCREGSWWWRGAGGGGEAWRVFEFLEDSGTRSPVTSPADAFAVGAAFGRFAAALATLPQPPLAVTIPRFHDLGHRWAELAGVSAGAGAGAGVGAGVELAALQRCEHLVARWEDAVAALPRRVAHNDAKADNVLFDNRSGALRAVIDLDTVMPGSILPDLGDLIRSAACRAAEDETDLSLVCVDDELFGAIVAGYAGGVGGRISRQELSHVVLAAQCITFEQAVRFLTDHLAGDPYYRIARPGHNLDRARTQLKLLEDLIQREDHFTALAETSLRK